jgi:hypothetical protein
MARKALSSHGCPPRGTGETVRHTEARVWSREQRLRGVLRGRQQLVAFVIQMNDGPTKIIVYILGLGIKDIGPDSPSFICSIFILTAERAKIPQGKP